MMRVLTAVLLLCFTSGAFAADDTVDLPFEYFYGRWDNGHKVALDLNWRRYHSGSDVDAEHWRNADYQFTADRLQIAVADMQRDVVFYDSDNIISSPRVSLRWRPVANLQLSLDSLSVDLRKKESGPNGGVDSVWRAHCPET